MIVVVDSTEFRRDRSLNKQDLARLKDFGNKELIEIHIPWFIYKETTTHTVLELETELNKVKNSLASLDKRGISPSDYNSLRQILKSVDEFRLNVKSSNKLLWDNYIKDAKATLHPFYPNHSENVFSAYFDGGKPFKSLKSRNDIPDAFIYMTIKELSEKDDVHLISEDNNLREKCVDENRIFVHKDFNSFFSTAEFLKLEISYEKLLEIEKIKLAKELLLDYRDVFEAAVKEYTDSVNFLELYETPLRSDNGDATVRSIDEPILTIDEANIDFYSNQFYVPIIVKAMASVDYLVFKADYWTYNDIPKYSEDWNEYYYSIEESFPIILKKTIIIDMNSFDEDTEPEIEIEEFDEIELEVSEDSMDGYPNNF